jgi:DNA polymerase-3 subunit epsilon
MKKPKNQTNNLNSLFPFLGKEVSSLTHEQQLAMQLAIGQGLPVEFIHHRVILATSRRPLHEETFCFVDIETTASKPQQGSIIEIGAIKIKNGEIIGEFESFGWVSEVPNHITDVTGITTQMVANAPRPFTLLKDFRAFLGDSVFVAHNITFDYDFISATLNQTNLGKLHNRRICTIELAKRTIEAEKYGLAHLSHLLALDNSNHHRAKSDALFSYEIFKIALESVPKSIITTEDLITFAAQAPVVTQMPAQESKSRPLAEQTTQCEEHKPEMQQQ